LLREYECHARVSVDLDAEREGDRRMHHETVRDPVQRYVFWRYDEFRVCYPNPDDALARRLEMVRLNV
jgi:hypothetical protein